VVARILAAGLEILGSQVSEVLADQAQHLLVLGRQVPQPVA
jgi:hypothetical protein